MSSRLRSDDEMSLSDKEKAALEILTDMKSTPDRRTRYDDAFVCWVAGCVEQIRTQTKQQQILPRFIFITGGICEELEFGTVGFLWKLVFFR